MFVLHVHKCVPHPGGGGMGGINLKGGKSMHSPPPKFMNLHVYECLLYKYNKYTSASHLKIMYMYMY